MTTDRSFIVKMLPENEAKPHFTWAGNASSEDEAVEWSRVLLDHARDSLWKGFETQRFEAMTRRVVVEKSDRRARYASMRMSDAFRLAATQAAKEAPTTIVREPGQRLPCDLTHWVARGLLASILSTDEAFVRASTDGGAHANLRTIRGSMSDGHVTRLYVEAPGIECGPDPDYADRGVNRRCVTRGEKPLYLSNATQAAAIMLAGLTWTVDNGDPIEFGSDPSSESATLRAAAFFESTRKMAKAARHAAQWFEDLKRPNIAAALKRQAKEAKASIGA